MKFTWEQYGISLSVDKDNTVKKEKTKVMHEHDKFAEFDKWFATGKQVLLMDVYEAIPMPDGDPLTGLIIIIFLYAFWTLIIWTKDKIK